MYFRFPVEPGEYPGLPVRGDSLSRILHMNLCKHLSPAYFQPDFSPFRRVLHSVVQQIIHGFFRPFPIVGKEDPVFPDLCRQPDPFRRSSRHGGGQRPLKRRAQILVLLADLYDPGLQPRHFHKTFQKEIQLIRLMLQPVQKFQRALDCFS